MTSRTRGRTPPGLRGRPGPRASPCTPPAARGCGEMIRAAVRGGARGAGRAGVAPPRILAVTALASLSDSEVKELGFGPSAAEMASRLADVAVKAGAGGLVCSAHEARALRA